VALIGPRQVGKTTLADAIAIGRNSIYQKIGNGIEVTSLAEIMKRVNL
jgi:predicted AAA+ superfamily ATPase